MVVNTREEVMAAFSRRLENACVTVHECPKEHGRASWLARQFNPKLTPQAVQKWFDGDSMPDQVNIVRLAHILKVDSTWLMSGRKDEVIPAFSPDDELLKIMRAWPDTSADLKKFLANAVGSTFPLSNK